MEIARVDGRDVPRSGEPWTTPGALIAHTGTDTVAVAPAEGARFRFGRSHPPDVDVCLGEDDRRVSRTHGVLEYHQGWWWLRNTGRLPIRISSFRSLYADDDPMPLPPGYTTLVIIGLAGRTHLLELRIVESDAHRPTPVTRFRTTIPRNWPLEDEQRLVLVVLGQRYLSREPQPRPLTRQEVVRQLNMLRPDDDWNVKRVDRVVEKVRRILSKKGVPGLTKDEVEEPIGNSLSHNLLTELTVWTETLGRADLDLLGNVD